MKKMGFVALAAATMLAASPASAVRWVEYTLSGSGIMTNHFDNLQGTATTTWSLASVKLILTVDADVTAWPNDEYNGSSTGSEFERLGFNLGPVTNRATFTADTISASSREDAAYYDSVFGGSWNGNSGTINFYSVGGRGQTGYSSTNFSSTVSGFSVRNVASGRNFQFDVVASSPAPAPEPATWGLMLVGFGIVGTGLRTRRRDTIIIYS